MAVRLVAGVSRDARGRTTEVYNPAARWSPLPAFRVIEDIRAGRHRYLVFRPPFALSVIRVAHGADGPYLRTSPDADSENNLDRLPTGADLGRLVPVLVRRNAADLTPQEWRRYVDAVNALRERYPMDGTRQDVVNWWFKQDQTHATAGVHEQPSFLPWHRELVNRFEAQLQEIDPEVTVPYWDWTTDPRATPDLSGRLVDLMTADFMGSPSGEVGPPFTALYDPAAQPDRDKPVADLEAYRLMRAPQALPPDFRASLPVTGIRRKLPPRGRGPREVTNDELDWSDTASPPAGVPFLPDDRSLLDPSFGGDDATSWDRMREQVKLAHGWAHRYIGAGIARSEGHFSFRDPFVFLLHSNVDRLYSSWQLRQQGNHYDEAWRLRPDMVYGEMATDNDMVRPMNPWSGGSLSIAPWRDQPGVDTPEVQTTDPAVVRPTLYDHYVWDDELCASWAALRLGRRLSQNDIIQATIEPDAVPAGSVAVRLVLGPDVTWWKAVRVPLPGDSVLLEADEDVPEAEATVPTDGLRGGTLVFHKAVRWWLLGTAKRVQYRVGDLEYLPDRSRLTLVWLDD